MTQHEFDNALRHIYDQYAGRRESLQAWLDQEMSRLCYRCGLTQDVIAARITAVSGKAVSRQHVSRRLIFGGFLAFAPMGAKPEMVGFSSLTERRFRGLWAQTSGKDRDRFARVLTLLGGGTLEPVKRGGSQDDEPDDDEAAEGEGEGDHDEDDPPEGNSDSDPEGDDESSRDNESTPAAPFRSGRRSLSAEVTDLLDSGRGYTAKQLVELTGATDEQIRNAINHVRIRPPVGKRLIARKAGKRPQYQIVPGSDTHFVQFKYRFLEEFEPIIANLEKMAGMHETQVFPRNVGLMASRLRRLVNTILEEAEHMDSIANPHPNKAARHSGVER